MHRSGVRIPLSPPRQRLGLSCTRKGLTSTVKPFSYAAFCSRRLIVTISGMRNNVALRFTTLTAEGHGRTNPLISTKKTHAKGAYKTPTRVSFSMQNRGKLPFLWQFTLFVVSSLIAVGICSSLALKSRKPLTIAQKGFLLDKERMISSVLINEKMTDRVRKSAVGHLLFTDFFFLYFLSLGFPHDRNNPRSPDVPAELCHKAFHYPQRDNHTS